MCLEARRLDWLENRCVAAAATDADRARVVKYALKACQTLIISRVFRMQASYWGAPICAMSIAHMLMSMCLQMGAWAAASQACHYAIVNRVVVRGRYILHKMLSDRLTCPEQKGCQEHDGNALSDATYQA